MKGGLQPLKEDVRDYPLGAIFGVEKDLPDYFEIEPFVIYDQGNSDFCASASSSGSSSIHERQKIFYPWAFAVAVKGSSDNWGTNLRKIAKVHTKYGCPTFNDMPKNIIEAYKRQDWDFLRKIENYPEYLYKKALVNKKESYMWVHSFNELKSTLWKFRDEKKTAVLGVTWNWDTRDYELREKEDVGYGHAILNNGFNLQNAILTNSYGKEAGIDGQHIINGELLNKYIKRYGCFVLTDIPRETVESYLKNDIMISDSWFVKLYKIIKRFLWT